MADVFGMSALEKIKGILERLSVLEETPGGGAAIDDAATATDKTWSSNKIAEQVATRAAASHSHSISNVTGLSDELAGKAPLSHTHSISNVTGLSDELNARRRLRTVTGAAVTTVVAAATDNNADVEFVANTVSGNVQFANPTGGTTGQVITWYVTTSGTGNITFANLFRPQFGVATLAYQTAQTYVFCAKFNGTNWLINWSTY
jgi:hypothetical protein